MKKLVFICMAVICAVSLVACGATQSDPDPSSSPQNTPNQSSAPALTMDDLGLNVNGTFYGVNEEVTPLLQALGEDYVLAAAPSCYFVGEDKEYSYGTSLYLYTTPPKSDGVDIFYLAVLTDGTYQTTRGIKVGDSKDTVIAAYGENYYMQGENNLTYSISGDPADTKSPYICFVLENDAVKEIDISYPLILLKGE